MLMLAICITKIRVCV